MRNIFSCIDFTYIHPSATNGEVFNIVERYLFKIIPLNLRSIGLSYACTLDEWRYVFKESTCNKSPNQLAELAISLGGFYRNFPDNESGAASNLQNLLSDEELAANLMLSYYYQQATIIPHKDDCVESHALDNFSDKYNGKPDRLYRQKNAYLKKNAAFKYSFLRLKETRHGIFSFHIDNPYDAGFLLSMLTSLKKTINPFVLNREDTCRLNLKGMMEYYKSIPFNESDKDNIYNLLKEKSPNARTIYNQKYAYIYNQILLERLSAINFFTNYIGKNFPEGSPLHHTLLEYALCPLLNFRLKVLELNAELFNNNHEIAYDHNWCNHLMNTLTHLVKCVIPIYEMIFFYLMETRYNTTLNLQKKSTKNSLIEIDMNKTSPISFEFIKDFYKKNTNGLYLGRNYSNIILDNFYLPSNLYIHFFQSVSHYNFDQMFSEPFINHLQKSSASSLTSYLSTEIFNPSNIIKAKI